MDIIGTSALDIREMVSEEKVETITHKSITSKICKRTIDILGSVVGIIALVPLVAVVWIMNKVKHENGPIFYVQDRIGKDGKLFKLYKFRTMVVNADELLEKYLEENADMRKEYSENKKLRDDPRITKVGKVLRRSSLDEFPQFINILKGEMSLVGPRPYLPKEKKDMGMAYKYIVQCTPGLTGIWQTSGRSDISFKERLRLDLQYYKDNSTRSDIKVIFKTVYITFRKKGAM